jgi:hypothetical protein
MDPTTTQFGRNFRPYYFSSGDTGDSGDILSEHGRKPPKMLSPVEIGFVPSRLATGDKMAMRWGQKKPSIL